MSALTSTNPLHPVSGLLNKLRREENQSLSGSRSPLERGAKKTRLQIVLGQNSVRRLDEMKEFVEPSTRSEVFRVSLRVLDDIVEELKKGNEFLIRDKNGNIRPYDWSIS
ncbi:MAG: hypothetical protein ACREXS_00445 [Gammaproteobacteria bacterium]